MVIEKIIKSNGGSVLWSVVKFCVAPNKSPTETLRMIKSMWLYNKCSPAFVYKWHLGFRNGRKSIEDDFRSGQPTIITCSIKGFIRVIADELGVSYFTVHGILTEELGMRRDCRWLCWESVMITGLKQRLTFSRHHTDFGMLLVPVPYVSLMDINFSV